MSIYSEECPEYLTRSLRSLVNQTLKADEVVLVEDGPIPEELQLVIEHFKEKLNIKSVKLEKNRGLAVALNEGLKYCSNELIARMDTDDISLPHRFEKQVAFMKAHPEVAVSSAFIEEVSETNQTLSIRKLPLVHEELLYFAKTRCPITHPVSIFRKSAVLSVGGYPDLKKAQDAALWSLMLQHGFRFANLDEVLLKMFIGKEFFNRRSLEHLRYELAALNFQRQIGFITWPIFFKNVVIRLILRLSPVYIKQLLYKYAR